MKSSFILKIGILVTIFIVLIGMLCATAKYNDLTKRCEIAVGKIEGLEQKIPKPSMVIAPVKISSLAPKTETPTPSPTSIPTPEETPTPEPIVEEEVIEEIEEVLAAAKYQVAIIPAEPIVTVEIIEEEIYVPEEVYYEPIEEYYEPEYVEVAQVEYTGGSPRLYEPFDFSWMGILYWSGYRWTYYSQRVLPGGGLNIPGRYIDGDGYVCDGNGFICLASDALPWGTVVDTPLGKPGCVYDNGTGAYDILDVYVDW